MNELSIEKTIENYFKIPIKNKRTMYNEKYRVILNIDVIDIDFIEKIFRKELEKILNNNKIEAFEIDINRNIYNLNYEVIITYYLSKVNKINFEDFNYYELETKQEIIFKRLCKMIDYNYDKKILRYIKYKNEFDYLEEYIENIKFFSIKELEQVIRNIEIKFLEEVI